MSSSISAGRIIIIFYSLVVSISWPTGLLAGSCRPSIIHHFALWNRQQQQQQPVERWLMERQRKNKAWKIRGGDNNVAPPPPPTQTTTLEDAETTTSILTENATDALNGTTGTNTSLLSQVSLQRSSSLIPRNVLTASSSLLKALYQMGSNSTVAITQQAGRYGSGLLIFVQQNAPLLGAISTALILATLSHRHHQASKHTGSMALSTMYALALLGSSAGFHLFLYFITVGYAMGIAIPLLVALVVYNNQAPEQLLPLPTNLHTSLVVLWGIRLAVFVLWRERINWPQLHAKVVHVNQMATIHAKLICWMVYSCVYVALATPCWSRLAATAAAAATTAATTTATETAEATMAVAVSSWNRWGYTGIVLQGLGLLLESIADYQKSHFKAQDGQRNEWCHVGLWSFSTHPNYLGEILFWIGTYMGGWDSLLSSSSSSSSFSLSSFLNPKWLASSVGLFFVMMVSRGAIRSLDDKQMRKYGYNLDFVQFRKTHSVLGPILVQNVRDWSWPSLKKGQPIHNITTHNTDNNKENKDETATVKTDSINTSA